MLKTPLVFACASRSAPIRILGASIFPRPPYPASTQPARDHNCPRITPTSTVTRNMASATSFYDFKPKDSRSTLISLSQLPFASVPPSHQQATNTIISSPQKRANPTTSPHSKTRLSSSSTPPPNVASHLNTPPSRRSTRRSPPRTKTSLSSVSPATSSCLKTPDRMTRSKTSASSTMALVSRSWPRRR